MKVSIDTKEDSHEDLRKVIRMLQNIVGDSQEVFSNQSLDSNANTASPFANIFGDASNASSPSESAVSASSNQENSSSTEENIPESTEDLFAELFSEEELKKMGKVEKSEEEEESEEEAKPKDKKYGIEFY